MSVLLSGRKYWLRAALVLLPAAAQAQGEALETVTVTAAHLPPAVGEAAFSSQTLSAEDLRGAGQLDAALEQVPGLSLFRRSTSLSANPTTDGVSLRAIAPSAAGRALVLLDGIPLNDPFGGWVIWSALPPEDIAGADIVRGAGSGPYGAGALTGTILLRERDDTDGLAAADISGGNLDTVRAGGSGGADLGGVQVFASGAAEHSNGWIPVEPDERGPADDNLRFNAGSASLRASSDLGDGIVATARTSYYSELQNSGLVGAESAAQGETASLALARAPTPDSIGWRLQSWLIGSEFSNTSVSTAAHQAGTTPADDQYATPALGWGVNAAALDSIGRFRWETGIDLRDDQGEARELYTWSAALKRFAMARRAGGQSVVAGLYGEGAYDTGTWLLTAGVRGDEWTTAQGHLVQSIASSGAIASAADYAGRDDTVPTGRAGIRRNFDDDEYLRLAAYAGFRAPTLNELYRPFRVGNVVTNADAALSPEKLDGIEAGWGGAGGIVSWNATGFWNVLHDAVENANVPLSNCPMGTGTCQRRENVGDIDALGLEADASEAVLPSLSLRQAVAWTDARVQPSTVAPADSGKRPAQAPAATITAGARWQALATLSFDAGLRWVSAQYEDDLNSIKLGSAMTVDLEADWNFRDSLTLFGRLDNALDAKIATGNTTGAINIGEPRIIALGIRYAN